MSDRLDIKLTANIVKVANNINSLNRELDKTSKKINKVTISLDKMGNIKNTNVTIKNMADSSTKLNKNINSAFSVGKMYAFWNVTKRIRTTMYGWVESSIDFIETTNKFQMSMGSMSDQATKFQNKISEAFGTARTEMMDFQANFKNILGSLPGLAGETSYKLSETLTQMGLDYASLFNVSTKASMQKIQAALVGNVKSIRSTSGYDITDATIADLASQLGVEKSVRQMSQMEKRLLRIISLTNQMKATRAMSDFARTIEEPANQIKVLKNQLQELGVWLGNVFIGTIKKILPYINGFVMALKEIVKVIAIFVGYKPTETIADPIQEASDYSSGLADNLGSAVGSAKELKRTLMGFDVLNVIQTPSSGGGGGGGADTGTIDPAILAALGAYDSMLDSVKMKANDIRDSIMDWLGFTKDINGEWKFSGTKLLKNIWEWWKKLNIQSKIFIGLGIAYTLGKIWDLVKKFVGSTGIQALFNWVKKLISPVTTLYNTVSGYVKTFGKSDGLFKSMLVGYQEWYNNMTKATAAINLFKGALVGLVGYGFFTSGVEDIINKGANFANVIETIGGALLTLVGTFTVVSSAAKLFGIEMSAAWATATAGISILITLAATIGTWIYKAATAKTETEEYADSLKELNKTAKDNATQTVAQEDATYKLSQELKRYIDTSGKVKDADKKRVEYILGKLNQAYGTEYKLVGDQITQNGKLVGSYKDIQNEIDKLMVKYRAKAILEAKHDTYVAALKDNFEVNKKLNSLQEEINKKHDYYNQLVKNGKMSEKEAQEQFDKATKEKRKAYDELSERRKLNNQEIKSYSDLEYAIVSENYDKMKKVEQDYFKDVDSNAETSSNNIKTKIGGSITDVTNKVFEAKQEIEKNPATFTIKAAVSGIEKTAQNAASTFSSNFKNSLNLGRIRIKDVTNNSYIGNEMKFTAYAGGGLPNVGEMFLSREAGPELVGRIGNRNAVVNNDQIVESVSRGVAQAVSGVMGTNGGAFNFYLDGKQLTDVVVERMHRSANISGVGVH